MALVHDVYKAGQSDVHVIFDDGLIQHVEEVSELPEKKKMYKKLLVLAESRLPGLYICAWQLQDLVI